MIVGLIFAQWIMLSNEESESDDEDSTHIGRHMASSILMFARYLCEIALFCVRLSEPGVRKFIKDRYRGLKSGLFARSTKFSPDDLHSSETSSLSCYEIIDELKQEVLDT